MSKKIEKISNSTSSNDDSINKIVKNNDSIIITLNVNIKQEMDNNKNLIEKYKSPIGISKNLLRIANEGNKKNCFGLSPISEIVLNLCETNIDGTTPVKNSGYYKQQITNYDNNDDKFSTLNNSDVAMKADNLYAKNPITINEMIVKDDSKFEEQNLISNNFTLNSTSSSVDSSNINNNNVNSNNNSNRNNISAARRLAARGAQRRLNIEPQILNFSTDDSNNSSIIMNNNNSTLLNDDLSFYDDITTGTTTTNRNLFDDDDDNIRNVLVDDDDDNQNCDSNYHNNELLSYECSPQRFIIQKNRITIIDKNRSLDEIDNNSIDSGYYGTFKFTEPKLPKKQQLPSPTRKYLTTTTSSSLSQSSSQSSITTISPKQFRIFHSLSSGSMESMDDEFMTDLIEMESIEDDDDDNEKFPTDLNSLISGHIKTIKTTPEIKRSTVRRCLSLTETNIQMNNNNRVIRGSLFDQKSSIVSSPSSIIKLSTKTPEFLKTINNETSLNLTPFSSKQYEQQRSIGCFKRPEPPCFSPIQSKRYKTESMIIMQDDKENLDNINNNNNKQQLQRQRPILRKSMSLNDAQIMTALARSTSEPDLIGDFSKSYCLPLIDGRHSDLKSISCNTLSKLINGEYNNNIDTYKIIDCRYPYEYDGGHIYGAQNLYTQEQVLNELVKCKTDIPTVQPDGPKRNILIFHCEFSSERGPKLSRYLRNYDRVQNSNAYPALYYPEIYLLHNGYKEFYENYSNLCDPISYRPMLEPSFGDLYRQFRAKSKSWNGDIKASGSKIGLKKSRSRLVL